ncbi:hypothetical protein MMC29_002649 [Sticta canariensis]|nr:hypothetical protein [Sticta canariensis]
MLSSPKSIRSRCLHLPTDWALSHTSKPSLLGLRSSSNVQTVYRHSNPKIPSRRSFSWGRKRQWGYSYSPGLYKSFESRSGASKDARCSGLYHNYFNDPDHSRYRYFSSRGWRLLNSWGRSGDGCGKFGGPSESGKSNEDTDYWYILFQKKEAAIKKEFEDFTKMVDADPYGMLFGWRNPYLTHGSVDKGKGKSKNEDTSHEQETSAMKDRQNDKGASTAKRVDTGQALEHASQPFPSHPEIKASSRQETEVEEYEFDPITMRRVPKRPACPRSAPIDMRTEPNSKFTIPVKPFVPTAPSPVGRSPHPQAPPPNEVSRTKQPEPNRITREGFEASNPGLEKLSSRLRKQSERFDPPYSKIETSLDRHLRNERTQTEESTTKYPPLKSKGEIVTESIDLLLPSDVRASAGLGGRSPKVPCKEKHERRKTLENDYERRSQYIDARLRDEVASPKAQASRSPLLEKRSPISSHRGCSGASIANSVGKTSDFEPSTLSNVGSEQPLEQFAESSRREAINRKKVAAKSVHEEEVNAQKLAMEAFEMRSGIAEKTGKVLAVHSQESGEGDMASNVYDFVGRGRWYKQRAPHAMKECDLKLQQTAKDRAFVREIRSIYEDEYGTIDTQHRQPSRQADREDKEHTQEAIDQYSKQPLRQVGQKDREEHEQVATDRLPEQSSAITLPDVLPGAHLHASETNSVSERLPHTSYQVHPIDFLRRQVERKDKEHTQEAINLSKEPSPSALPGVSHANSSSNNSAKLPYTENGEPERPGVSKPLPKFVNESGIELPASADRRTGNPDAPTTWASLSSDESGSSSAYKPISPEALDSTKLSSYRILAYDPSTQRVTSAKTTSLTAPVDEKTLTLVEALSRLAMPAKFLPHFASLQNSGYEIVSGSTNVLIFKNVRPAKPASHVAEESFSTTIDDKFPRHTNPIDGTTTQTGNFASPTGFVNYDAILPPSEDDQPMAAYPWSMKPNDKVTRQQEDCSGSRHRWEDHPVERMSKRLRNKQRRAERRKRTLKRMGWASIWMAGCCYAVGVGLEFLRV